MCLLIKICFIPLTAILLNLLSVFLMVPLVILNLVDQYKISNQIALKHVLFVLQFQFNLLSVSCLSNDSNLTVIFSLNLCYFQNPSCSQILLVGAQQDNLYTLLCSKMASINSTKSNHLCHQRMSHASHIALSHLPFVIPKNCKSCDIAKQHRSHFSKSVSRSQFKFQLTLGAI